MVKLVWYVLPADNAVEFTVIVTGWPEGRSPGVAGGLTVNHGTEGFETLKEAVVTGATGFTLKVAVAVLFGATFKVIAGGSIVIAMPLTENFTAIVRFGRPGALIVIVPVYVPASRPADRAVIVKSCWLSAANCC